MITWLESHKVAGGEIKIPQTNTLGETRGRRVFCPTCFELVNSILTFVEHEPLQYGWTSKLDPHPCPESMHQEV